MPTSPHTLDRHCAPMRTDADKDTRVSEMYATADAINAGLRMVQHREKVPGCTGPCDQGRKLCPCPESCGVAVNDTKDAGQQMRGEFLSWLTPRRFWWGYVVALLIFILCVHLYARR